MIAASRHATSNWSTVLIYSSLNASRKMCWRKKKIGRVEITRNAEMIASSYLTWHVINIVQVIFFDCTRRV